MSVSLLNLICLPSMMTKERSVELLRQASAADSLMICGLSLTGISTWKYSRMQTSLGGISVSCLPLFVVDFGILLLL